ncbi:MAG: YjfB family protein [Thermochromatium sp.]
MDISSTVGLASYTYTPSSNKTDTSASLAMLKKANEIQADMAKQMIQSVTQTPPAASALPDHLGRNINVTA